MHQSDTVLIATVLKMTLGTSSLVPNVGLIIRYGTHHRKGFATLLWPITIIHL